MQHARHRQPPRHRRTRRHPRRLTAAVLATGLAAALTPALAPALAGGGGSPAAAAPDATPGYSVRALTVDVLVGPDRDQPCTVAADLYTPDGVSRHHRAPAILTTHGFGGAKDDENQTATGSGFAREGYVVLSYSGLGFGGSGCRIHLDDPDWDGVAGKQLVSVLAGEKAATDEVTGAPVHVRTVAREAPGDPRVGHDRRLVRRPDPVRGGDAGPARRRADPVDHLERPVVLTRPEQHRPGSREPGALADPRRLQA